MKEEYLQKGKNGEILKVPEGFRFTKSKWDSSFEYVMGIFAILSPLIATYIISRLLSRSRLTWVFIPVNFAVVLLTPFLMLRFVGINAEFYLILISVLIYSTVFVPFLTFILRSRRIKYGFQGKWKILEALKHHKILYISSFLFYVYFDFYFWTFAFRFSDSQVNYLFYIFTSILTLYYLILGIGIAKVGMETKKKRKLQFKESVN